MHQIPIAEVVEEFLGGLEPLADMEEGPQASGEPDNLGKRYFLFPGGVLGLSGTNRDNMASILLRLGVNEVGRPEGFQKNDG